MDSMYSKIIFVAVTAAIFVACDSAPPPSGPVTEIAALDVQRHRLEREWRNARWLEGQGARRVSMGTVPEGGVLRFGVFSASEQTARVYIGERAVYEVRALPADAWSDHRVELNGYAGEECTLWIDAASDVWLSSAEVFTPRDDQANVLIVLADTLRLDFLHCYYFPLETSPNIDAFAKDAIKLWELYPPTSWTRPSVGTLLTGVPPNVHKAQDLDDVIRGDLPTLFDVFMENEYATQAFITNPSCLPFYGFGRGFQRIVDTETPDAMNSWIEDRHATDLAVEAIHNLDGRPWAMYVHLMGPHRPYDAPEELVERFMPSHFVGSRFEARIQRDKANYAAEVAQLDTQFARLVGALKDTGVYDDTLVVFLSDHGEQFHEHGEDGHAKSLFEHEMRVPFIVKLPGNAHAGREEKATVEMEDVPPFLLELLELPVPETFEGTSFTSLLPNVGGTAIDRSATATLRFQERLLHMKRYGDIKFIHDAVRQEDLWYDVAEDPREIRPYRRPPPGAEGLRWEALYAAVEDAPGLHVMVRRASGADANFEIMLDAAAIAPPTVTDGRLDVRHIDDEMRATWTPAFGPPPGPDAPGHVRRYSGQARFHADIDATERPRLTVLRDGGPVAGAQTLMGKKRGNQPLGAVPLDLEAIVAGEPGDWPDGIAVRVWYVTPPERKPLDTEDGELKEALEALGYLD